MRFTDRLRAWFRGDNLRGARTGSRPTRQPAGARRRGRRQEATPPDGALDELEDFAGSRHGVEGFLEPRTAMYPMSLVLVAADGEYLRRQIGDRRRATTLCTTHGIPLYDAAKVGYPQRMRDYDRGIRPRSIDLSELPPWPGDGDPGRAG